LTHFVKKEVLLQSTSRALRTDLERAQKDDHKLEYTICKENLDILERYLIHATSGKIPRREEPAEYHQILARLYCLGGRLLDERFQNRVVDEIASTCVETNICPSEDSEKFIYQHTPEDSPARRLMVDIYYIHGLPEWMNKTPDSILLSFYADVTYRHLKRNVGPAPHLALSVMLNYGGPQAYHQAVIAETTLPKVPAKRKRSIPRPVTVTKKEGRKTVKELKVILPVTLEQALQRRAQMKLRR
jgi:hypothetical protein